MRILLSVATTLAAISMLTSPATEAQVDESGYTLPLSLAIEAATEAIRSCEGHADMQCPPPWLTRRGLSSSRPEATTARSTPEILAFAKPTRS